MKIKPQRSFLLLTYWQDPGHGWLEVPRHLVPDEILAQISHHSYQIGGDLFLEEDDDMPKYINYLKNEGVEYKVAEINCDKECFIRKYQRFSFKP
jgi:hypothetical protein